MTPYTSPTATADKLQPAIASQDAFLLDDRTDAFTPRYKFTVYLDGILQGKFSTQMAVERLLRVNMGKRFEVYREVSYSN